MYFTAPHYSIGLTPSAHWRVADRDTGKSVRRTDEHSCAEWLRAQLADDVRRGRYVLVPPSDQVVRDIPGWGTVTADTAADGALVIWCDFPDPLADRLRVNVNELPVYGYGRVGT